MLDDDVDAFDDHPIVFDQHLPNLPRWPLFRPLMTTTSSPLRIFLMRSPSSLAPAYALEHFRRERDDAHVLLLAQLAADRAKDAGAARVALQVDQHGGVVIELDVAAIRPAILLRRPHDDRADDIALLDCRRSAAPA